MDDHWFWFRGDVRVVGRNKPSKYASGFAILGFLSSRRGILYSLLVRIFAAILFKGFEKPERLRAKKPSYSVVVDETIATWWNNFLAFLLLCFYFSIQM